MGTWLYKGLCLGSINQACDFLVGNMVIFTQHESLIDDMKITGPRDVPFDNFERGSFDGWYNSNGNPDNVTNLDGKLRIEAFNGSVYPGMEVNMHGLEPGREYTLTYEVDMGTTTHTVNGILRNIPYTGNIVLQGNTTSGTKSFTFTAPQADMSFSIEAQGISSYGHWYTIDNFKLTTEPSEQVHGAAAKTVLAYKYRREDVRLGRFMSVDPLASQYPHNSPYAFSEN